MNDTNTLFYGDNLDILRAHVADESVDLVYLDPPFNSNRSYNVLFRDESGRDSDAQIIAFEDSWHWGRRTEDLYADLVKGSDERLVRLLTALVGGREQERGLLGRNPMSAYLVMMAARLVELQRVLKPTGSLYLHCDDAASHYLKLVLDAIFTPPHFRNHIAWRRAIAHNDPKRYGRIQDHILYYVAGDYPVWNGDAIALPRNQEQLAAAYPSRDDRGRFRSADLTGPLHGGSQGSPSTLPWQRYDVFAMGRCWSVPRTGRYAEYIERNFIPGYRGIEGVHARLDALDAAGLIYHPQRGKWPGLKRYADADTGNPPQDLFLEPSGFTNFNRQRGEHLGFPTQKPEALLERIIRASSNEGDLVLDPFCGCGTAIVAAETLGRRWLGIDITHLSVALMKYRLHDRHGLRAGQDYRVIGEPQDLAGARNLAEREVDGRYQFQWWALSLVHARPQKDASGGGWRGRFGGGRGVVGRLVEIGGERVEVVGVMPPGFSFSQQEIDLWRPLRLDRENVQLGAFGINGVARIAD